MIFTIINKFLIAGFLYYLLLNLIELLHQLLIFIKQNKLSYIYCVDIVTIKHFQIKLYLH